MIARWRGAAATALLTVLSVLAACGGAPAGAWVHPQQPQWRIALEALGALRAAAPTEPYAASVRAALRDAATGRVLDARGAIAVAPGRAVRMILVGGPGQTVLDAWVTRDQWRVSIPPSDRVQRGGAQAPDELPVAFLRWWFVAPFRGSLFAASTQPDGLVLLLRDGGAVVDLRIGRCDRGGRLTAARREHGRAQSVDECRARAQPTPGDFVRYADETTGLSVDVVVESAAGGSPDTDAFVDPDVVEGRK